MKSTTKQENNRTLKRPAFSYLNVQALAPGSATVTHLYKDELKGKLITKHNFE